MYDVGTRSLRALSAFLANKPFMLGSAPSSLDAVAFGFLGSCHFGPFRTPIEDCLRGAPNLVAYCERMKERFYPDWDSLCAPMSMGQQLGQQLLPDAPNLRRGILAASALSIAVVLGEFTIASLLSRVNLQTSLLLVSQSDPFVAVIFALLALVFAFVLLVVVDRVVSARRRTRRVPPDHRLLKGSS